jgi:hypothetical protein
LIESYEQFKILKQGTRLSEYERNPERVHECALLIKKLANFARELDDRGEVEVRTKNGMLCLSALRLSKRFKRRKNELSRSSRFNSTVPQKRATSTK